MMNVPQRQSRNWCWKWLIVLTVVIVSPTFGVTPVSAQAPNLSNLWNRVIERFRPSRNRESPSGRQFGAATRDLCPVTEQPLAAVIPNTNLGLTLAEHPTLWFYMPYASPQPYSAEFVLIDANENDVYKQTFSLPDRPGIVSFQIPDTVPALAVGEQYRWVLSVICNPDNRSGDTSINGWIQRTELTPDQQRQLNDATTLGDRLLIYSENQLWYEMVFTLGQELRAAPQNQELVDAWSSLLTSIGFSEAQTQAPVTTCCQENE